MENATSSTYSVDERKMMLKLAREAVEAAVVLCPPPILDLDILPDNLRQHRACFVSLYHRAELRGCTGVLIARLPLASEVMNSAAKTAISDPRFSPVIPREVPSLHISISILTPPTKLLISSPSEIIQKIRPGIDGVTLTMGLYRATFLPQVWDRVPDPTEFLNMLCQKMGLPRQAWRSTPMEVETYQSEEVSEVEFRN